MTDVAIDIHRDLIDASIRGEHTAFHQLYKLYSRAMYNAAFRIIKDTGEAEDILQEAFISAFEKLHTYKGDSTFGAWLKRIVVNKAINHLRKRHRQLIPLNDALSDIAEVESDVQDFNINGIKKAIAGLPDGYRLVLTLYLIEGYDHNEIAEILNISVSTSKSQFNRAKNKLRNLLAEKEVYYG
jgi:RNA polymerase sigma factor (sigma-70 family)